MAVTPNSIITPQTPQTNVVIVSAANTNFITPTATTLLVTAGANGARLTSLKAVPLETVTQAALQFYRSKDAGVTKILGGMVTGQADTVSATDAGLDIDFGYSDANPRLLAANERIYVAPGIAKSYAFIAEWADY